MILPANRLQRRHAPGAFILLEVLISLVIVGIAVAVILRSFTLSLESARRAERANTGLLLAQSILEEIQIAPPEEGHFEGDFGADYPGYSYDLTVKLEEIDYKNVRHARESRDFKKLRTANLEVFYKKDKTRLRVANLASAVDAFDKFSQAAMQKYQLFESTE